MASLFDFEHQPGLFFVWATLLPLIAFTFLLLVGGFRQYMRRHGELEPIRWPAYVATGAIFGAFLLSLTGAILFFSDHSRHGHGGGHDHGAAEKDDAKDGEAADHANKWQHSWRWAGVTAGSAGGMGRVLTLGYNIDELNVVMFLMVTFIATLIHLFSMGYMSEELQPMVEDHQVHDDHGHFKRRGRFGRFFLFLSLFCFSMLNLILADNLFQIFLSWELVGICSFLLIGFYYERRSASTAANKAFITNRVGDAGFIIGLLICWSYFGTFNFQEIFAQIRAPQADAHGDPIALSGQIIRGEVVDKEGGGKAFRLGPQEGASALLLSNHPHADDIAPKTDGKPTEITLREVRKPRHFGAIPYWVLVVCGLGIFLGCVGKSAQFPLHVWLPDAMEGPTPVSALIHAATMVAAGVYLVGRCYPLFAPEVLLVIAYTGAITLFVAATIAIVMTDIKKVLAYSTVSQLGYMMLALGIGGWVAGLMHLITHAFFKALLFLGSGSVIYGCHHEQEMTKMGGLLPKMKITGLTMLVGVFAIAGIPLFSGWYSKDAILAQALSYMVVHRQHALLFILPLMTAGITTFYMFRMWFMTFTGDPRDAHVHEHAHETPPLMTVPLILLAIFSVCVAWPFHWNLFDAENSQLEQTLHHAQPLAVATQFTVEGALAHDYHMPAGLLATGVVLLSIVFASLVYWKPFRALDPAEAKEKFAGAHAFLTHKWYFDELYSAILVRPALVVAHWAKNFDGKVIDGFVHTLARTGVALSRFDGLIDAKIVDGLVNVLANAFIALGGRLRAVQTGSLRSYVLFLALATVAIVVALTYIVAG